MGGDDKHFQVTDLLNQLLYIGLPQIRPNVTKWFEDGLLNTHKTSVIMTLSYQLTFDRKSELQLR